MNKRHEVWVECSYCGDDFHCPDCGGAGGWWEPALDISLPIFTKGKWNTTMSTESADTIPFTEEDVKKYLDDAIGYWRGVRDDEDRPSKRYVAAFYIDAFQSVRISLFGYLLPTADDSPVVQKHDVEADVNSCARCGKDHPATFLEFAGRNVRFHQREYTHWGICPNTGDPILMLITEEEEGHS